MYLERLLAVLQAHPFAQGWSQALLGRSPAAICELQEGVARWQSTGARLVTPFWMYVLASALDQAGRHAEAVDTLDAALAQFERTDERWFECELYILKASQTARAAPSKGGDESAEVQRHLRRALRAATEMESPSLRLRAANAWSRLLRDQGQTREAKDLVGAAYAAFDEGFQTADLAEARAMLAQR